MACAASRKPGLDRAFNRAPGECPTDNEYSLPCRRSISFALIGATRSNWPAFHQRLRPNGRLSCAPNRKLPSSPAPAAASAWAWHGSPRIFEEACTSCHRWTGVSLLTSYATHRQPAVNDQNATNVTAIVISGEHRNTANGMVIMPAFGNTYSDTEIAAVANYVTGRLGAKGLRFTAPNVAKLRP